MELEDVGSMVRYMGREGVVTDTTARGVRWATVYFNDGKSPNQAEVPEDFWGEVEVLPVP